MDLTTSLKTGGPWPHSCFDSSSSLGSLVCPPTVLKPPLGKVFENGYCGNIDTVLSDKTYAHEANQAPRQWCGNTNVLESLAFMPQISVDSILCANQNILPNCVENSQRRDCQNTLSPSTIGIVTCQPDHSHTAVIASTVPYDFSPTQPIDPILQQSLLSSGLPSFVSGDATASTGNKVSPQTSIFQSRNNDDITSSFDEDYTLPFFTVSGNCSSLLPTLNELSFESLIGSARLGIPDNTLARCHTFENGENASEASTRFNKRSRTGKEKVVKVFPCLYDDCPFTASCRKDLRRHLQSDKHRKDHVPGTPSWDRSYCEVPGCKFADEGFSRRDNLRRHMKSMHDVILEREKPGLKRSGEE
ncbi:hypothetical protein F5B21DRAFT_521806 [Xylaria acuta]|nr:hypothetical protein F5B21DRAFT_521806 [Xylaria acuta]